MPSNKLKNYLRTYRKRAGLSQGEVAFLLGCEDGTKVSRYERFSREPNFQTAIACEVLFGASSRELFAGVFQKVEKETKKRARLLVRRMSNSKALSERSIAQKLEALQAIASGSGPESVNHPHI